MLGKLISLNVGQPIVLNYQGQELSTGIYKAKVSKPLFLTKLNFEGDGQADLVHHGGVDKAVCVYCSEHYPFWEQEMGRSLEQGAFGENLTVAGLLEQGVCLGDIFQLGEAVVQISQPRSPCHKLAKRHNQLNLPLRVQETGYTGFYFRVLQEGLVSPGDQLLLKERHPQQITVAYANQIMYQDKQNIEGIKQILAVAELSSSWRETFLKRLAGQEEPNPRLRLEGKED